MNRYIRLYVWMLLICSVAALAQGPTVPEPKLSPGTPVQRVEPPSVSATAQELEQRGDLLRSQKYYLDAIDYYTAAMKKSDSAILHNKMGIAFMLLERSKEAKKEFERSLHLDPKYAEAHNNLGALFYTLKHYGNAIREYRRAIALNEENPSFHVNLGSAYFFNDDIRAAMRELSRARELDPDALEHHGSGGASLRLISAKDLARFHYMLAQVFAVQGDVVNCRHYLSKASEEGYLFVHNALKDDQFSALRKDPEFIVFVRSLKPTPPPPPAAER